MSYPFEAAGENVYTFATPFGGCGGGAYGGMRARAGFRGLSGRTELLGGYDSDPYACRAFEYLTGVAEACADARALTPADVIRMWGPKAPWAIVSSPPCVGATALISHEKASTAHYVEMNGLMLPSTQTILDAYGPDPMNLPAWFLFENVPGLGSERRGGKMLKALCALLRRFGYEIHMGHHNARHIGGGAQNRVRLLVIARNKARVPVFLYKPPHLDGLVVGDVLGPLPLPDDPRGGPMHRTTARMSFLNRLRLWAIEAGKDWRCLRDRADALKMKVPPAAHANLYRVVGDEPAPVVTCATRPGGGALSYAAPVPVELVPEGTAWHPNVLGVLAADQVSGCVTGEGRPTCGRFAVAAPVPIDLVPCRPPFKGAYGVLSRCQAAGAITGEAAPSTGTFAVSAPVPVDLSMPEGTFQHVCAVADWKSSTGCVTTSPAPSSGALSAADPRVPIDLCPQAGNPNLHENKYIVLAWDGRAKAVTTATRIGSGAPSVAQPIDLTTEAFRGSYGVLSTAAPAGAVKCNSFPTTGPYSVAAPVPIDLVPPKDCFDAGYGVLTKAQPSRAIASTSAVGCGAYAIADEIPREPIQLEIGCTSWAGAYGVACFNAAAPTIKAHHKIDNATAAVADPRPIDLQLGCQPHKGAYGVQDFGAVAKTVLAQGCIDNTTAAVADPRDTPRYVILTCSQVEQIVSGEIPIPFAVVDPARPDVPLAIVDDLKKPAYRIERTITPKEKRVPVTVVLVSADGTWHRELTTLELAVLQQFPWLLRGVPLDFGGGTTEQRGVIGNAIPPDVMEAVFRQIIISSLASQASFFLAPSDWEVWVQGLRDEGYEIIDAGHRPLSFGAGVVLDDGAVLHARKRRTKPPKRARSVDVMHISA